MCKAGTDRSIIRGAYELTDEGACSCPLCQRNSSSPFGNSSRSCCPLEKRITHSAATGSSYQTGWSSQCWFRCWCSTRRRHEEWIDSGVVDALRALVSLRGAPPPGPRRSPRRSARATGRALGRLPRRKNGIRRSGRSPTRARGGWCPVPPVSSEYSSKESGAAPTCEATNPTTGWGTLSPPLMGLPGYLSRHSCTAKPRRLAAPRRTLTVARSASDRVWWRTISRSVISGMDVRRARGDSDSSSRVGNADSPS